MFGWATPMAQLAKRTATGVVAYTSVTGLELFAVKLLILTLSI
jgi:hypothetical protein